MLCNFEKYRIVFMKIKIFFDVDLCFVLAEAPLEYELNKDRDFACFSFFRVS